MEYTEICNKIGMLKEQADEVVKRNHQNDEWSSEDQTKFDALHKDIARYREQKRRLDMQAAVEKDLENGQRQTEPNEIRKIAPTPSDTKKASPEEADHALRAWMLAQAGSNTIRPEWRSAAQKLGVDLNRSEFPFRLPSTALQSLRHDNVQKWESRALTLTTTAGGYLISNEMVRALEEARLFYGGMLEAATVIRTDTGAALPFPTYNGTATKGRILGINTQVTATDPAFGTMSLSAFKYSSDMVLVPEELLQDSGINMPEFLGRALGERIGRILNEHFTTGTGTTQPWGIVPRATAVNLGTGTAAGFGATTDGTAYRNLLKLVYGVDRAYRRNAAFMMNDLILQNLAGMTDNDGRPLWVPSLIGGEPDRLMGYPIIVNNDMTGTFANNARTVLFGDFKAYYIREVRDVAVLSSRERFIDYHQTAFLAFGRYDGDLLNAGTGPVKAAVHQT
jgi:HK97 family phage major capsid protein